MLNSNIAPNELAPNRASLRSQASHHPRQWHRVGQDTYLLIRDFKHRVRALTLLHALAESNDPPPSYAAATASAVGFAALCTGESLSTVEHTDIRPQPVDHDTPITKDLPIPAGRKNWSHKPLHLASTSPALWWGLKSATTFLLELLRNDGVWSNEKKFRVTEVALAILWVRTKLDVFPRRGVD